MARRRGLRASRVDAERRRLKIIADLSLPVPPSLRVSRFEVEGEEFALLSFPVPQPTLPEGLTPAEQEIVRGVVGGASNGEIAKLRGVSANTVANQLRAVYEKLGIRSRYELVSRCVAVSSERGRSP